MAGEGGFGGVGHASRRSFGFGKAWRSHVKSSGSTAFGIGMWVFFVLHLHKNHLEETPT